MRLTDKYPVQSVISIFSKDIALVRPSRGKIFPFLPSRYIRPDRLLHVIQAQTLRTLPCKVLYIGYVYFLIDGNRKNEPKRCNSNFSAARSIHPKSLF